MFSFLRAALPLYFIAFFGLTFVLPSIVVSKRIGKSPFVLPKSDDAYGLIGQYFKLSLLAIVLYVVAFGLFPSWHILFLPISWLDYHIIQYIGIALIFSKLDNHSTSSDEKRMAHWHGFRSQNRVSNSWAFSLFAKSYLFRVTHYPARAFSRNA